MGRPKADPNRTHCIHGHELTEDNRFVQPDGKVICRTCRREIAYQWRERNGLVKKDLKGRFWDNVGEETETGCWRWAGNIGDHGYGRICHNYQDHLAHRLAYELFVGPIPKELQIDHLCRNRWCVNPGHLEPVTLVENLLRGETLIAKNLAKTHCPAGHEYTPENTILEKNWKGDLTKRKCRECVRIRCRRDSKIRETEASIRRQARPLTRDFSFISPEGEPFISIGNLKRFCTEHGLPYKQISKLHRGDRDHVQGWHRYEGEN